jgi:hypothetical protein
MKRLIPSRLDRMPCIGWMYPGRSMYAAANGNFSKSFSVLPFTRPPYSARVPNYPYPPRTHTEMSFPDFAAPDSVPPPS